MSGFPKCNCAVLCNNSHLGNTEPGSTSVAEVTGASDDGLGGGLPGLTSNRIIVFPDGVCR